MAAAARRRGRGTDLGLYQSTNTAGQPAAAAQAARRHICQRRRSHRYSQICPVHAAADRPAGELRQIHRSSSNSFLAVICNCACASPSFQHFRLCGVHRTAILYHFMQALNVAGGVAFAALLSSAPLSLAVPAANGSSLLANAACDWLLGERMNLRRARLSGSSCAGNISCWPGGQRRTWPRLAHREHTCFKSAQWPPGAHRQA